MAKQDSNEAGLPARRSGGGLAPVQQVRAHLECIAGPEKGQTFRLVPGTTTLGRDPGNEVVLTEQAVSRQHARIERRGDQWVLVNLSANGTRLEKEPIDEAVLADENEIRVGAKTRLVFFVEQVAVSASGRPQFRARTGRPEDRDRLDVEREEADGEPEAAETWFERRKKLVIGLGIYLCLIVVAGIALTIYRMTRPGGSAAGVEILQMEDMVYYQGEMYPKDREAGGGYWVTDDMGNPKRIPAEAVRRGEAREVRGIKNAILKDFDFDTNPLRAKRLKNRALELYGRRQAKPENLFLAVRLFQQALAYEGGRSYFQQPIVNRIYEDAEKELIRIVYQAYRNAVLAEKSGDLRGAEDTYQRIIAMIPERKNHIVRNVTRRLAVLRERIREEED